MNELQQLKKELEELKAWKKSLEMSQSIPLNIDQAFRKRFFVDSGISASGKSATSENQSVNEGGVATYSVLKAPDAFLQVVVQGSTYYIPVFT